jgi:hydrogenase expression/formation protein HypD
MGDERQLAGELVSEITKCTGRIGRSLSLMEVCGTHTVELRRKGIHSLLPKEISLVSGPGCPVCVTPAGYVDNSLLLAESGKAVIATFGDMLKVPGAGGRALSTLSGRGLVKVVYSPTELTEFARRSSLPVVFLAVGFETTIPTVVSALLQAREAGVKNLLLYTAFKVVTPALRFLLSSPDHGIDGFILPGHVSVIIGEKAYSFLTGPEGRPGVITGFESLDMLMGILLLVRQIEKGERRVENAYPRAVKPEGNPRALALMEKNLEPRNDVWRGLGVIPGGALGLRPELATMDAEKIFELPPARDAEAPGCICSLVIAGKAQPIQCALFGRRCTPDDPVGPCMVSSEGTCAAYFRYGTRA